MLLTTLLSAAAVYACTSSAGSGGQNGGAVSVGPTGIPLTLPPTPAPVPPPPPPPIAIGWVPAPPRQMAQDMTRQNCEKSVEFFAESVADSGNDDLWEVQESFVYKCTYKIYVEVVLFEAFQPTDCACGVSWTRPVADFDDEFDKTYDTKILDFNLVVYHVNYKKPIRLISEFSLGTSSNTTLLLREEFEQGILNGLTSGNGYQNFTGVTQGFYGKVDQISLDDYPELDLAQPENRDHVAAMCFTVEDTYVSSYRWPEPPMPVLGGFPHTYFTNCVPWYPSFSPYYDDGSELSKRWHDTELHEQVYWFRDFLLFKSDSGADLGYTPSHRYVTSYYLDANCNFETGVLSFVRQFDSQLERHAAINGAFLWTRTYTSTDLVGGTPKSIDTSRFNVVGFQSVVWFERLSKEPDTADSISDHTYVPGRLWHIVNGSECTAATDCNPTFDHNMGTTPLHYYKLCEEVPADWFTCTSIAQNDPTGTCGFTSDKYLENAIYFRAKAGLTCAEANGYTSDCTGETTLLSFQNIGSGQLARDYRKKPDSLLLTGSRLQFCSADAPANTFDSLVFYPFDPEHGISMAHGKRGAFGTAEKRFPKLNYKRQGSGISTAPEEPMFGHPEAEEIMAKPGGGSANVYGEPGGDHPLELFPETYTVPVSLDPADLSYSAAKAGWIFSGVFSPCLKGTRGCTCRNRPGRPECDSPYECNDQGFCVDPPCEAGDAGCDCINNADGTKGCSNDNLECHAETLSCTFKSRCNPGETGCTCAANDACDEATSACYGGRCIAFDCPLGLPGCECLGDSSCYGDFTCSANNICKSDTPAAAATVPLGRPCSTSDTCDIYGTCTNDYCTGTRCIAGSTGCRCNVGQCESPLDECNGDGICVTQACEPGAGGCECYQGRACSAGFDCANPQSDLSQPRGDRCVKDRCDPGNPGCPCDSNAEVGCNFDGFECLNMLQSGEEYRCVATGVSCGLPDIDRCIKFCGEGNVLRCPGCDNETPVCVEDDSSSTYGMSLVLALLAAYLAF